MHKIIRASTVPQSINIFCKGILKELSSKYEMVVVSSPGPLMQTIEEREGVKTIAVKMERRISLWKDLKSLIHMIRVFRKERPTLVHSITPKAGLICMMAGWITKVPIRVHTFTGLVFPTSKGLKRKILMFTDKLTCACATHVNPEGKGVRDDLANYGITHKPMKILGNGNIRGVDMTLYSRRLEVMEKAAGIRSNLFTFVYVGRIVKDKGIDELCEAFERLQKEFPHIILRLVGSFEDDVDPISEQSKKIIENNKSIEAIGAKYGDDFLAYYASADCFVMPSYREGFPNTVLEAGALGLPSVVTDINGSREIIIEGENGLIVPPQNSDALYGAMKKMLTDEDSRKHMADNARKLVADRFEQGYVRKCLYDYYEELFSQL